MKTRLLRLALIVILVSLSCAVPAYWTTPTPQPSPRAVSQLMMTAGPDATATATPFQPVGPTSTPIPSATPEPTATAEPEMEGAPALPTPIRSGQPMPEGTVNLMVLGNDSRFDGGYRTDVMMLVSIHGSSGTVSVVSFPRDLYVTIPGWTTQRINTAFAYGGFPMLADTLEYNFGVRPSYYIMTNFQGFIGIIDSLGGVKVNAANYLSDKCDLPQAVNGYCTVNGGPVIMDGSTALWYVRSRYTTSDFDRTRRAQEVLYGLFDQLMSIEAVSKLPELYDYYKSSVETNMGIDAMTPLLPIASTVIGDSSRIHRYAIGPAQVTNFVTSGGAMVLLPNYDAINAMIAEAVYGQ